MSTLYNFKIMKATHIYTTSVWSVAFSYRSSYDIVEDLRQGEEVDNPAPLP